MVEGFTKRFPLQYKGPIRQQDTSQNLPFSIGNKFVMWEKIIKEVKLGRYAGPHTKPPYLFYVQSPLGLVPKAGDNQTRLIFHLSYDFSDDLDSNGSVNHHTPYELCTVKYRDLDHAVKNCLKIADQIRITKHSSCDNGEIE